MGKSQRGKEGGRQTVVLEQLTRGGRKKATTKRKRSAALKLAMVVRVKGVSE